MIDLQTRLELQVLVQQWVDSIIKQYNISAIDMEEALIKTIFNLKQQILQDYFIEQQEKYQKNKTSKIEEDNN